MSLRLRLASIALASLAMLRCGGGEQVIGSDIGPPARVEILAGNGQEGTVGQPLGDDIVVQVTDAQGHPVRGVSVAFGTVDSSGVLAPGMTDTDASGEARASWTLGWRPGLMTAVATVEALPPADLSATAHAGPAAHMRPILGEGQRTEVGTAVGITPQVELQDAGGNPVAGVVVRLVATGGGTVSPEALTTGVDGRAAPDSWVLGTTAGENTLRVTSPDLPATSLEFRATGVPGAISSARSAITVAPSARIAGEAGAVSVKAKDAFGNPVQGASVHLSATGSGHRLTQPSALTDADGVTVGNLQSSDAGTTTVSATAANVTFEQQITVSFGEGTLIGRTYCTIGGESSVMDVYVPGASHQRPLPVAVHVHGGGYTSGHRSTSFWFPDIAQTLLDRGYLVVSLDYRLAPTFKYPAQIQDVKCAIRHLRANADLYGLDPDRIGAWGSSAGGQLVALLGTADARSAFDNGGGFQGESSKVRAVVAMSAITDFTRTAELNDNYSKEFPSWPDPQSPELREASPTTYISADDGPFMFIVGDEDDLVLPVQSQRMSQLLRDANVTSSVLVVAHANHGLEPVSGPIMPSAATIIGRMADFFDEHLR